MCESCPPISIQPLSGGLQQFAHRVPAPTQRLAGPIYHAPPGAVPFADFLEQSNRLAHENEPLRGLDVAELSSLSKDLAKTQPAKHPVMPKIADLPAVSAQSQKQQVETVSHARMQGSGTIIDVVV